MRCIIQRVQSASVSIDNKTVASIGKGLMVLAGYTAGDNIKVIQDMAGKIVNLRIFDDSAGKLNLSVNDIDGEILIVPNFTLYADASRGRRPDFIKSLKAEESKPLFEETVEAFRNKYNKVSCGVFGANMQVNLVNDGPLTIIIEK